MEHPTAVAARTPQMQSPNRVGNVGVIWAVHPIKDDVSAALRFGGSVHYINNRYIYPDEFGIDGELPSEFEANLRYAAISFRPSVDYLLMSGDYAQLTQMAAFLGPLCGKFKILRFDRHAAGYIPATIADLHQ